MTHPFRDGIWSVSSQALMIGPHLADSRRWVTPDLGRRHKCWGSTALVLNVGHDLIQGYDGGVKGFGIRPWSNATLYRLTSTSGKFKVSLVSSC